MKWKGLKKYLVLIPLIISFVSLMFFSAAYNEIMRGKFLEKAYAIKNHVNLVAVQINKFVELDDDWNVYNYEPVIKEQTEYIDNLPLIFAAAYNDKLELCTERRAADVEYSFDPFIYPEFIARLYEPFGEVSVIYNDGIRPPYNMLLYWRWIPDGNLNGKYLMVTGVSKYAIIEEFKKWIFWGCGMLTLMMIASQTWLVIQISAAADVKRKKRQEGNKNSG